MPDGAILVNERRAAEMLGLSTRTLYKLRMDGELPFINEGRAIRYRVEALMEWAAQREQTNQG